MALSDYRVLVLFSAFCCGSLPVTTAEAQASTTDDVRRQTRMEFDFFERHVRPVLARHCWKCHGEEQQKGGLRLDSRSAILKAGKNGPAAIPGDPDKSRLVSAIRRKGKLKMPPDGPLDRDDVTSLTRWVAMGLPWPAAPAGEASSAAANGASETMPAAHWSFQPIRRQPVPEVDRTDWPRSPIDNFILAKLEATGLSPSPPADRRSLIRRVTYDLIGLPPTPEQIDMFLHDDSPNAYEQVVRRLLASPRYGERWARHWLDLVRFAETTGQEYDFDIPYVWRYRDFVVRAFNDDVPYDRFVVEHIAGDLLKNPRRLPIEGNNESIIGTTFYWIGQQKGAPIDPRAEECDRIADQIDVLSKTFLGLSLACARCHDHKFDPLTMEDYYALAGYLKSSRRQNARIDLPEKTRSILERMATKKAEAQGLLQKQISFRDAGRLSRFTFFVVLLSVWLAGSLIVAGYSRGAGRSRPAVEYTLIWSGLFVIVAAPFTLQILRSTNQSESTSRGGIGNFPVRSAKHFVTGTFDVYADATKSPDFSGFRRVFTNQAHALAETNADWWRDVVVFEDFDNNNYQGWYVTGEAFGSRPTRAGDILLSRSADRVIDRFLLPGFAHSGLESGKLRGTLRSQDFLIEKPYILYRVSRRPPLKQRKAEIKFNTLGREGQIHLIVDGLSKDLIFSDEATLDADDGEHPTWYHQEIEEAWMGHRAYIEIVDEDDGFVAVDCILFSDSKVPPPVVPNRLIVDIFDDPSVDTMDRLSEGIEQLFAETVELWTSGRLAESKDASDRIALLNWLWENGLGKELSLEMPAGPTPVSLLDEHRKFEAQIEPPQLAVVAVDGTPVNERLLIQGDHRQSEHEVPRRFLEVLAGSVQPAPGVGSGRLGLARRLVDRSNPLPSRVMVNRLWQHHFGRGIVETPDDFGARGALPTHPQLLDYLAAEFQHRGWSLKSMHRLMVFSNTYRMSSGLGDREAEAIDPENRLLHRMPLRRLEAESIRDAILAVSDRLNTRMFGPSVQPFLTAFMDGRGRPDFSGPLDGNGRRSLYITVRRNFISPMFLAFDYPTPDAPKGARGTANIPAQALTMMNNPFVVQQARVWAERVLTEPHATAHSRIVRLFETAYGRPPSAGEAAAASDFLIKESIDSGSPGSVQNWADLCHVLFNGAEFIYLK